MKPQSVATQRDTALRAVFAMIDRLGFAHLFGEWDALTHDDRYAYLAEGIEGVIEEAEVDDGRAFCPLCGASTQQRTGFAYPNGLRWHLHGWKRMPRCVVIAAIDMSFERFEGKHDR